MIESQLNIGAAIIVKNNEKSIADTLNSIMPICKQIVVVDTGSYDRTAQVCSRLGAEVFFFKWINDFSAARNFAISLLRTDWIFSIDSDEVIDTYLFKKNSNIFIPENTGGINVIINNYLDRNDLSNKSSHRYTRIFKNHPQIRFSGKIHEQIHESIFNTGLEIIQSDITINHFGYQDVTTEKILRNQEMLKNEIIDSPDDPWKIYHLAAAEFAGKNFDVAEIHFKQIYNSKQLTDEQREISKLRLSQICLKNENFIELGIWTDFNSDNVDREGFRKYIQATSYLLQKHYSIAKDLFYSEEVIQSSFVNKENLQKAYQVLNIRHSIEMNL
jgi:glycosyltransferase involved in cell wall biosynthesis